MALKDIGSAKSGFEFNHKGVAGILQRYAQSAIDAMKRNMVKYNIDPQNLYQAITYDVKILGRNYQMTISLPSYYVYVDKGVKGWQQIPQGAGNSPYQFKNNGKSIPFAPLYKWAFKKKGLFSVRKSRKGKSINTLTALKSFVFMMGRSIKRKGLRARPFFTEATDQKFRDSLALELRQTLKKDIIVTFKEFDER